MLKATTDRLAFARDMKRLRKPVRLTHRWKPPVDGLWKVETRKGVRGAYLVAYGHVTRCSPRIRRHLHVWAARNAQYSGDPFACE